MGLRQRGYWLRQADAIRRQKVATIAQGIGIGMASDEEHQKAVDELELAKTVSESKKKRSELNWQWLLRKGGGAGV